MVCVTYETRSKTNYLQQKQQYFAMYHPGIDAISSMASLWPMKMITVVLFDLVLYFMANLKREPGAFFIFVLITYITSLMMCSLFRFIAAINKHEATAMSIAGVLILPLVIYTGCKQIFLRRSCAAFY